MKRFLILVFILCSMTAMARQYHITAQRISTADGLPSNIVSDMWQSEDGFMWFNTITGLCRYDGYSIQLIDKKEARSITRPKDRQQEMHTLQATWVRRGQGKIARIEKDKPTMEWQLVPREILAYTFNDHIMVSDVDAQTEVISTYGSGLYLYDKPSGELTHICKETYPHIISNDYLTRMFVDKTGCIWIVEDYLGIKCLRLNQLRYQRTALSETNKLQEANNIRCLALLDEGKLLVGNQIGEIYEFDTETDKLRHIKTMGKRIYAALRDSKGRTWVGTRGEGLWCDGKRIENLPSTHIYKLIEDTDSTIWICTLYGGVIHIQKDGELEVFMNNKNCHDFVFDKEHRLWIATEDSLFMTDKNRVCGIEGYYVCLNKDDNGYVYAGSRGQGLFKCRVENGEIVFTQYISKSQRVNNNIYSITLTSRKLLWLSTEDGLLRLNPNTGDVQSFNITDSQLANVFNERAAVYLPNGNIVFGSHDGIIEIEPPTLRNDAPMPTLITEIMVNGAALSDSILSSDISLDYSENNITFHFSNFQYDLMESVLYQYQLEGYEKEWNRPTQEHTAVYRHLQPGKYTFKVRSSGGLTIWSEDTSIDIVIRKPWWNTWWAWVLYLFLASSLLLTVLGISHGLLSNRK